MPTSYARALNQIRLDNHTKGKLPAGHSSKLMLATRECCVELRDSDKRLIHRFPRKNIFLLIFKLQEIIFNLTHWILNDQKMDISLDTVPIAARQDASVKHFSVSR